ncbi:RxLR effector protein [Phytophthora megakarya]|uniref:RxLR effector protein n=1 Tax=Phytophthora megakarya TaxID=4795 RepID=A0A225VN80_9STRA|nr:RxLR effector protein [Phytophthora megakarya]
MRFSVFLALLIATFIACTSVTSAEHVSRQLPALPIPGAGDKAAKGAATFLEKLKESATITKAVKQIQGANGDETVIRAALKMAQGAKEGAKISDDAVAKLSATMATAVTKSPKSWPKLRKFVKITLGATVGGLAIYGAYKLLTKDNASTAATTTTTGSA